jgi:hypothetical protein
LMSSIHALWEVLSLHEKASLTLRFDRSSSMLATQAPCMVQTGGEVARVHKDDS